MLACTGVADSFGAGTMFCGFGEGVMGVWRVKLNSAITSASGAAVVIIVFESGLHPSVLEVVDEPRFDPEIKGSGNEPELELDPCSVSTGEVEDRAKGPSTTSSFCSSASMTLLTWFTERFQTR